MDDFLHNLTGYALLLMLFICFYGMSKGLDGLIDAYKKEKMRKLDVAAFKKRRERMNTIYQYNVKGVETVRPVIENIVAMKEPPPLTPLGEMIKRHHFCPDGQEHEWDFEPIGDADGSGIKRCKHCAKEVHSWLIKWGP